MWQRKMMLKHKLSPPPINNNSKISKKSIINKRFKSGKKDSKTDNDDHHDNTNDHDIEQINHCDHINYPHDYRKHSKKRNTFQSKSTSHSFTNRLSSIFQSRQD